MRLELSLRAIADLDDIRDFSVERFGAARAILYLDAIERAFRRLLAHPEIGVLRDDLGAAVRSYPVEQHRIYYVTRRERVVVRRVLHKAMDVGRRL